jgi:hypothetical protein
MGEVVAVWERVLMCSDRCKVEGSGMRSVDWLAGDADGDFQFHEPGSFRAAFPKSWLPFSTVCPASPSATHEAPSVASSTNHQDSLLTLSTSPYTRPPNQPRQHVGKGKGHCVFAQEEDDQASPNQCSSTDSPRRPEHVDSLASPSTATTLPILGHCPSQQQPG